MSLLLYNQKIIFLHTDVKERTCFSYTQRSIRLIPSSLKLKV